MFQRNNGGASKNLIWGALKHLMGASEHRTMGVLRGTLDRGPLKHQIGSCIWDNVKDPIRSFRVVCGSACVCVHAYVSAFVCNVRVTYYINQSLNMHINMSV